MKSPHCETPVNALLSGPESGAPMPSLDHHSPADILDDSEFVAARSKILGFVELIAPKVASLSITGIGYIRSVEECEQRIQGMQRDQLIAVAKIIPD